eukprot:6492688-Amphidinium_carterae.1
MSRANGKCRSFGGWSSVWTPRCGQHCLQVLKGVGTWNARGFLHSQRGRHERKRKFLEELMKHHSILGIQEAHAGKGIESLVNFQSHASYWSAHPNPAAGGLGIFLRRSLGATSIRFCEVLPGRIACLNFVVERTKIAFYNVHIFPDEEQSPVLLLQQLHAHVLANRANELILAGDWNFEHDEDSSSAARTFFLNEFSNFSEIHSDSPTYVSYSGKAVSRIDRIYFNCCPAVLTSLQAHSGVQPSGAPSTVGSDHRAVRVYLLPASENDPKVPLRIYDSPNWMDVSSLCIAQTSSPNDSAFTSLRKYATAFMDAAQELQEREQKATQDACSDYAKATQALWHALAGRFLKTVNLLVKLGCGNQCALRQMSGLQLRRLAERMVAQQIDEQVRSQLHEVQKDLDRMEDTTGLGEQPDSDKILDETTHLHRRRDMIIAGYAAWKRHQVYRSLNSLQAGDDVVNDPTQIIDHLTEHWHHIFDSVLPCDDESALTLLDYAIPFHFGDPTVSLTDVKRLILRSPNTAPGPDGIQMRAWQTHVDKVAPIFLQAYNEWLDGQLPAGAAKSVMVCLPKTSLPSPEETRPLCLINTWLKTLVRLLIFKMEDSMAGEIHMNQFGFLKGRSTKQCFLELVRCMVEMGLMQETSFTVLWDFAAAFPSINRDWIWRVLARTGCEPRCIRALQLYYQGDSAFIKLSNRKGRTFKITRGVRQGCPGSGLLWAIALDPVVRAFHSRLCRRSHAMAALWYADDLSTVLQHADDLDLVDALFKLVSLALSLQIKTSKICVLVHHPQSTTALCELLCERYPGLKAAAVGEHVTHLGHEIGAGADDRAAEQLVHKVGNRAETFKQLATGLPMGLVFVNSLLLSPCWYRWSVGVGSSAMDTILGILRRTLLRGPPKWLPDECLLTLKEQLSWPMSLPHLHWHAQVLQVKTALRDWSQVQGGLTSMHLASHQNQSVKSGTIEMLLHASPHQVLWDAVQWAVHLGLLSLDTNNGVLVRNWDPIKGFTPWTRYSSMSRTTINKWSRILLFRQRTVQHKLPARINGQHFWQIFLERCLSKWRDKGLGPVRFTAEMQTDKSARRALHRLRAVSAKRPAFAAAWLRIMANAVVTSRRMGGQSHCQLVKGCQGNGSLSHYLCECRWYEEVRGRDPFQWLQHERPHALITKFWTRHCDAEFVQLMGQCAYLLVYALQAATFHPTESHTWSPLQLALWHAYKD